MRVMVLKDLVYIVPHMDIWVTSSIKHYSLA